jgi:hypothetical protein
MCLNNFKKCSITSPAIERVVDDVPYRCPIRVTACASYIGCSVSRRHRQYQPPRGTPASRTAHPGFGLGGRGSEGPVPIGRGFARSTWRARRAVPRTTVFFLGGFLKRGNDGV